MYYYAWALHTEWESNRFCSKIKTQHNYHIYQMRSIVLLNRGHRPQNTDKNIKKDVQSHSFPLKMKTEEIRGDGRRGWFWLTSWCWHGGELWARWRGRASDPSQQHYRESTRRWSGQKGVSRRWQQSCCHP